MIKIVTTLFIVLLVVNVSLVNADWQSAAQEACQRDQAKLKPGLPPKMKPCNVMCTRPGASVNTFQKLADGTECTIKNNPAGGSCKNGKCVC